MSRRPTVPDVQFFAHDSDAVRLEKLRRFVQDVRDWLRVTQPNQTTVTPTVGFTITGPAVLGRIVSSAGDAAALTPAQITALLNVFATATKGLVPAPGSNPANNRYLHESGAWAPINLTGIAHNSLSGLDANDHPQYLRVADRNPFMRSFLFMGA